MSRFLPKLFLRSSAETDISTIASLQAGKFLPSGIQQDSPTPGCLQLCPPVLSNCSKGGGETQSLYFAFKRWEGIHNQGLCIMDLQALEWSLCVCGRSILSESEDGSAQYTTLQLFGRIVHQPTKESRTCGVLFALRLQPNNLLSDVDPINPLGKPHKPPSTQ